MVIKTIHVDSRRLTYSYIRSFMEYIYGPVSEESDKIIMYYVLCESFNIRLFLISCPQKKKEQDISKE